jgi:hypothetical protein
VEHEVSCTPPPGAGGDFTWKPRIELSVSPPKQDTYKVGEEVTVTWHWVAPPRNPWNWVGIGPNTETPTGTVKLSNAQVGDVAMAGPDQHDGAGAAQPLPVADMTGRFTVAAEGRIDLAPGGYELKQFWIASSPCKPIHPDRLPVSTSMRIGTAPTPGGGTTSGANAGASTGGSPSTGGAGGTTGGTTGGAGSNGSATGGATPPPATSGGGTPPPTPPTGGTPPAGTPSAPATTPPSGSPTPGASTPPGALPAQLPAAAPGSTDPVAGPLFMRQEHTGVTMPPFEPAAGPQRLDGRLNPITIQDHRGGTLGWTLTGQLSDFVGDGGEIVPARRLTWTPTCATLEGPQGTVGSGLPGPVGGGAELLCRQNPSAGGSTAGSFEAGAGLSLALPGGSRSEVYTGNLTLSLS